MDNIGNLKQTRVFELLKMLNSTQKSLEQKNIHSKSHTASKVDDDEQFDNLLSENDSNVPDLFSLMDNTMNHPPGPSNLLILRPP